MFTVVFEVHPAEGKKDEYLDLAKHLKPMLESIDGFIDNERFESKRREGWVLSLSTWRDEKAVVRWRTVGEHHKTQGKGRDGIFSDYRLRVSEVTSDSHPPSGMSVVEQRLDPTEIGEAKALAITEITPSEGASLGTPADVAKRLCFDDKAEGLVEYDVFESITNAGKLLLLTSWRSPDDAGRWAPRSFENVASLRHRRVRNVRQYGMFERREASQYFPASAARPEAK
jgi:heme-degrading monooxygenase HmoA